MLIEEHRLGGRGVAARTRLRLAGLVVQAGTRPGLDPLTPIPVRRRVLDAAGRVSPVPRDVTVDVVELGGVRTWRLRPRDADPRRGLLMLHGGGYNYGGLGSHGGMTGHLARMLGATAWLPDYRLIPEHPPAAPLADAVAAWTALASLHPEVAFAVSGDSAGGGLALSLACEARDRALPLPACLLLHSPWVDADPAMLASRPHDRILSRRIMRRDLELWLAGAAPDDPLRSPIHRDLAGLPPTLVQWGATEALHADAERLVSALDAAGVAVTGEAYTDLWHCAHLHVPVLRESREWIARTTAFAGPHLAGA